MKITSKLMTMNQSRKRFSTLFFSALFILLFPMFVFAESSDDALSLLNKMNKAVQTQDYQLYFISQDRDQYVNTFEYSHIGSNKANICARLLYLEGPAKEIVLHNNITSYFQPDSSSFSITSSHIVETFPDVIYSDLNKLTDVYDFVILGKTRVANRSMQLVKIIAKDKDRYSYIIGIDDATHLPIRIDLIDLNNELIQQIKVVKLNLNFDKEKLSKDINSRTYPTLLAIEPQPDELNQWQLSWLPKGFNEISAYNISFYNSDIATKLFSDGIFSFTVNISEEKSPQADKAIVQGGRTIYSTSYNNQNIIIIGNLPLNTIEKIAKQIVEKSPQ